MHSTLLIKQATLNDAGTYTCKFGHLKSDMHVNVAVSGDKLKSSGIFFIRFMVFFINN